MNVKLLSYSQPTGEFRDMGIADAQELIAYCARVSNPNNQFNTETSEKLIRYLVKHAQLKSLAGTEVLGKQDTFAYAHPEYVEILEGIRAAVEIEERYRWLMTAAQARIECWRTEQYSARIEMKATS